MHSINLIAVAAAVGAGVQHTVLPITIANGRYSPGIAAGKFQGVIAVMTPRGRQNVKTLLEASSQGLVCASKNFACSAAIRHGRDVSPDSSVASPWRGFPSSVQRMSPTSSFRASMMSATLWHRAERSHNGTFFHSASARFAASTARRASSRPPLGI